MPALTIKESVDGAVIKCNNKNENIGVDRVDCRPVRMPHGTFEEE